ncbi:MAG: hypothetical protein ACXWMN_01540, partial [Candidatus Limnocylindria bacterium]
MSRRTHQQGPLVAADELLRDLDLALAAALDDLSRRTPGARTLRQDGLLLAIGADPSPVIVNSILPVEPHISIGMLDRAVDVFRALGHGVGVFTRDHLDSALMEVMQARGFHRVLSLP